MKSVIIFFNIFFVILLLTVNEFTLSQFTLDNHISDSSKLKIRYFNLLLIFLFFVFLFYRNGLIKLSLKNKLLYVFILLFAIEISSGFFGFGYRIEVTEKSDWGSKDIYRYKTPYDMFRGKPNVLDHNKFGFRGPTPKKIDKDILSIGFFGGSTGYNGEPPIAEIISNLLNKKNIKNVVYNFSSTSSNHNQHLHRLVEFIEFKFDLIIFYGGGNETIIPYLSDPRVGYPSNFYMDNISSPFKYYLIKYSNIFGEIDKITGFSSGLKGIQKRVRDTNIEEWKNKTVDNYFNTLEKAKNISQNSIKPNKCSKTNFLAIFQPLNLKVLYHHRTNDKNVFDMVHKIEQKSSSYNVINLSKFKKDLTYRDSIHIDQKSKEFIGKKISEIIIDKLNSCTS